MNQDARSASTMIAPLRWPPSSSPSRLSSPTLVAFTSTVSRPHTCLAHRPHHHADNLAVTAHHTNVTYCAHRARIPTSACVRVRTDGHERGLDVVPADAPECRQERSAPCAVVEMTQRRAVRHEHVGLGWLSMSVIVCTTLDRWGWEEGGNAGIERPTCRIGGCRGSRRYAACGGARSLERRHFRGRSARGMPGGCMHVFRALRARRRGCPR
ncbi:hypothetical protein L210DRAFT_3722150 [Boletus edulis BED1]|uniref:Uncharacterized protein n=1 Tax=Boletus edulis BED1 TaxID=1328754 RepID=A0AAD4BJ47_BOLED|nr:hypothetical protein L210DRAFT_3722150 [Boletus edulis BED1]